MARKKKAKFYAVRMGHKPGVYQTWEKCRLQVEGYPNADYKSFSTLKHAEDYLNGMAVTESQPSEPLEIETRVTIPQFLPPAAAKALDEALRKQVVIYTDGACVGNPGPGGYAAVLIHGEVRKELSAGFRLTTNNRMEILACIAGLQALKKPCDVTIYSDSKYVVNTMTKSWALRWRKHGWKRKDKSGEWKEALNQDLWIQMLELCERHRVRFQWVRGHDGNAGNERCDELARAEAAAPVGALGVDSIYESPHRKSVAAPSGGSLPEQERLL